MQHDSCAGNFKSDVCCPSTLASLKSISGSVFELESVKHNMTDAHTHKTDEHQFQKPHSPGGVLLPCEVSHQLNKGSS